MNMKTGFFTFDLFHGRKDTGSSRIRCLNLIKYWRQAGLDMGTAEEYRYGGKYGAIVFQKAYFYQFAEAYKGIKILDLCDADWLNWNYGIVQTLIHCDAITCSTEEIADFMRKLTKKPIIVIPDRVDFDMIPRVKEHFGDARKVVWFGYSDNFEVLDGAVPAIKKRGLGLIVIANKGYIPTSQFKDIDLTNYPWNKDTWIADILRGDIVINPKFSKGRFKYKSNNKTTQAWALGMPVAEIDKELDLFATEDARKKEAGEKLEIVRRDYDVKQSVVQLKNLINDLQGKRE